MYNYTDLSCPNCYLEDHVQKVSSIVESGTTAGTSVMYVDGIRYVANNQSQTVLSQILSPPPEPTYRLKSFGLAVLFGFLGIVGAMYLFGSQGYMEAIVGGLALITMSALGFYLRESSYRRRRADAVAQVPEWRRAVAMWRLLYYCHRCSVVFLQDKTLVIPPTAMHDYLYREFK